MFLIIFLIIGLHFLNSCSYYANINVTAKLEIPIGKPTKKTKSERETLQVTIEAKMSKCSI